MQSLIDELPAIVREGKKEVARILERLSGPYRLGLQTSEVIMPAKERVQSGLGSGPVRAGEWGVFPFPGELAAGATGGGSHRAPWQSRLVYGDNLLVMQALLAGDAAMGLPSLREAIDLIYIDPPFDSKADYRTARSPA